MDETVIENVKKITLKPYWDFFLSLRPGISNMSM